MDLQPLHPPASNLGVELHSLLSQYCNTCANNWTQFFLKQHPAWRYGPLPDVEQQIEELNWYWRINLGLVPVDTRNERAALVSHISAQTWLSNFDRYIITRVVEYQLPTVEWSKKYV